MARALEITRSVISNHYRKIAGLPKSKAKAGAVTLIQRFGGTLNLNVHFHQLFIDGCYELGEQNEPIDFYVCDPPTMAELDQVLSQIIKRLVKYLERQKIIVKETINIGLVLPMYEPAQRCKYNFKIMTKTRMRCIYVFGLLVESCSWP